MPAKMWLSVQTRITALVLAIALLAVFELVITRSSEARRIDTYLAADAKEHAGLLDRTLELEGSSLATFAKDYTNWGEMVQFVQTGDRTWASVNLDEGIGTYQANAAWVFDAAGAPVYAVRDSTLEALLEPLPLGLSVKDEFGDGHFCHFFIAGPDGPVEIRGATIHPSDDDERTTPVRGYFLAARSWNRQYLAELAQLTGKTLQIEPARVGARPSTEIARQSREITFVRPLPGPRGIPELTLTASLRPGWTAVALSSGRGPFTLQMALALLGVLALMLALWFWVTRPLGWIRHSLESGSTEPLKPLERSRTEFGQLAGLIGQFFGQNAALVKEVTERKQAEAELAAQAERAGILFEHAPDAYYLSDFHGTFLDGNRTAEELLGYPREELVGASFLKLNLLPASEVAKAAGLLVRNALGQSTGPDEFVLRRKDGTMVPVEINTHVVTIHGRKTVLGSARDITERKQAEEEIERLSRFPAENPSPVLRILSDGALAYANPSSKPLLAVLKGESGVLMPEAWQVRIQKALSSGQQCEFEETCGSTVYSLLLTPIADHGYVNIYGRDVTERKQAEAALRESETRLKEAEALGRTGNWEFDLDGQKIEWSDETYLLYERDKSLGPPTLEEEASYYAPDEILRLRGFARQATEEERDISYDLTANLPSGRNVFFSASMRPVKDETGRVVKLFGTIHDITDRRQAEQALHESEKKYRLVVDNASEAILVAQDGKMVFTNPRTSEIIGYPREELLGRAFIEFIHPDDRALVGTNYLKRIAGEDVPNRYEFRVVGRDPEARQVEISAVRIEWMGRPATLNFLADITKRKRAESEVALRAALLDAATDLVVVHDLEGNIVYVNEAACRMHGYEREQMQCMNVNMLLAPGQHDTAIPNLKKLAAGSDVAFETEHRRRDGSVFPIEVRARLVESADGRLVISIVRDITQRKHAEAELAEQAERLRILFEHAPDAVYLSDLHGTFLDGNRAAEELFGYRREELIGQSLLKLDLLPWSEVPKAAELLVRNAFGEATGPDELKLLRKDGAMVSVETCTHVVTIQGRKVVLGSARDITERRRTEAALRESEERFRGIFDAAWDGMVLAEVETGRFVTANGAFCNMVDYDPEEVAGLSMPDVHPSDSLAQVKESFDKMAAGEISLAPDIPVKRRDGSVFYADVSAAAISLGGRNLLMGVFRDTTERKRTETALRESEERFKRLFAESPSGIVLMDAEGVVQEANPRLLELIGIRREDLVGRPFRQLLPGFDMNLQEQDGDFRKRLAGEPAAREITFRNRNGKQTTLDVQSSVVESEGRVAGVMFIINDITERKRAEEALLAKDRDIKRSNADLEQFAYVASHDLQEPLRMVGSFTQLLARRYQGRLDKEADEFIGFAVDGVSRMQLLINDLLTYSRVGRRGKEPQPIDSGVVLGRALQNLKLTIEDNKGSVTYDPLPVVMADDRQLEQLFQNLVGNAVKYHGDEPPRVHISAERSKGWWTFAIKDNGIGIEPQYYERIFQVFQRLHTRKEYSGTGIGLAVCSRIVERHGGRIWVESEPGKGSTFKFILPAKGA